MRTLNLYTNSLLNIRPTGGGKTARKEVKTMDYDIIWNEEEATEIEALNGIFGL